MTLGPDAASALAKRVLELAEEVERAERAIKRQLLEAADRGDIQRISYLVRRWMEVPVVEVLRERTGPQAKSKPPRAKREEK